ncbi:methylesterase 17-like [Zingiber officinale]|uniref:methylesterase 17-like n=1 Tax=Zingiber officinale TaxID=94328 RepID=UPI001C4B72F5|nr:methylesterase 17-like [Zingiber officinale]
MSRPEHFVLVHGVGHGAWCWFKVRCHLESAGHKVSCLDMLGHSDPNSILCIQHYDAPLLDFMSHLNEDEKVVLVGHSAGGLSLTHAMHAFKSKIKLAIFVAATMLPWGYHTEEDIKDGVPNLSRFGDVYELTFNSGPDNPPTSVALRKEFQRSILYQLSPVEAINQKHTFY